MKLSKKTKLATMLVLTAVLVGSVYAAFYLNRPVTFHGIVVATDNVQVYSDSGCTQVLSDVDIGSNLTRYNGAVVKEFWVKNIGDDVLTVYYNVTTTIPGLVFGMTTDGSTWLQNTAITGLGQGGKQDCFFNYTITPSTPLGPVSFTVNVWATA